MFSTLVIVQYVLVGLRISFDLLNYIPAAGCVYHSRTVENCTVDDTSHNLLGDGPSETLNTIGAFLEVGNSVLLLLVIFKWHRFHVGRYCRAILQVGHFWVWILLWLTFVLSLFGVRLTHGTREGGAIKPQAIAIILECLLVSFLALSINFVARVTYDEWIEARFQGRAAWLCKRLYGVVLMSYFFRHVGLFLYDTALVAMSISLSNASPRPDGSRGWESLLLVLNAMFRGSIVKFFFVKFFQRQHPLKV